MSLEEFELFMRKEKKIKKYDQYVEGFKLFQKYLLDKNIELEKITETILTDYIDYAYASIQNYETFRSSYGNYILRFYLGFVGKDDLILHLDKLKQINEQKVKQYDKELMNQPKFVINLEMELTKHLDQETTINFF